MRSRIWKWFFKISIHFWAITEEILTAEFLVVCRNQSPLEPGLPAYFHCHNHTPGLYPLMAWISTPISELDLLQSLAPSLHPPQSTKNHLSDRSCPTHTTYTQSNSIFEGCFSQLSEAGSDLKMRQFLFWREVGSNLDSTTHWLGVLWHRFSEPQFPCLQNWDNNYFIRLLQIKELMHVN